MDWIRMRTDLYRDPKVCLIADHLLCPDGDLARYVNQNCQRDMAVTRNVMRNVTVGALVTVWGVTRHRGKRINDADLLLRGATLAVVDDIADLPGFGEAMASVGWAEQIDEGVVFPHFFEEFNTDPKEDAKKKNAERQRRYRKKQEENRNALRNGTVTSQSNVREEKIREENKEKKSTKRKAGSPPTVDEVRAYCAERSNGIDPEHFVAYYAARGWKTKSGPIADWKACVITWEKQAAERARDDPEPQYPKAVPYKVRSPEQLAQ